MADDKCTPSGKPARCIECNQRPEDGCMFGCLLNRAKEAEALLTKHQWASEVRIDYDMTLSCCPECGGVPPDLAKVCDGQTDGNPVGHADDCALALAIGATTRRDLDV